MSRVATYQSMSRHDVATYLLLKLTGSFLLCRNTLFLSQYPITLATDDPNPQFRPFRPAPPAATNSDHRRFHLNLDLAQLSLSLSRRGLENPSSIPVNSDLRLASSDVLYTRPPAHQRPSPPAESRFPATTCSLSTARDSSRPATAVNCSPPASANTPPFTCSPASTSSDQQRPPSTSFDIHCQRFFYIIIFTARHHFRGNKSINARASRYPKSTLISRLN
ncbi:pentatricopeptide repeat (PPR) superfamily protein [Striga asiatica]|uniref:Pentatricopeptide repeat (PPR) superfamily protein n=1 Tax=Striga asiatica TaxID=4170 RepID=A0A5A7P7C9_STRAF|nr:pentatricopeptide repeat (PPR) superfamily protein [Striga asiatica]